jgi:iron complex outermembrane recepter protein
MMPRTVRYAARKTLIEGGGVLMRLSVAMAVVCLSVIGLAVADEVRASIRKPTNIPAGDLASALQTLAKDRNFQVVYVSEEVNHIHTQGAVGEYTSDEALKQLLKGSGLTYRYLDEKTITVTRASTRSSTSSSDARSPTTPPSSSGDNPNQRGGSLWDRFPLAQADQRVAASTPAVEKKEQASNKESVGLQEVVVTAQKRTENLLDVPVPVTAIDAQSLVDSNQFRLQDYYTNVPGLSVSPGNLRGDPILTIRGITTGGDFTNPTVGIVLDDVPLGTSTGLGAGGPAIDLDPSDLMRVEVLRGPQGTLYGASSIGGLLKYVTTDPSTDGVSGRVQAGIENVHNGAQLGYSARVSANVPLSDTLAFRASGYTRQDPGYVDDIVNGQRGVNESDVYGGRLSALWRPSERFSLKLSALFQDIKVYGSPNVEPDLGDLKQSAVPGTGTLNKNTQFYSATLTVNLGRSILTSLSGYSVNKISDSFDSTPLFGSLAQTLFGVTGAPELEQIESKKFSQEIRLSTPIGQTVEWLLGAFYTHEDTAYVESVLAANFNTGAVVGTLQNSDSFPSTYDEYAAFTDLTFHATERFDVQLGGRESKNRQSYMETIIGAVDPIFYLSPSPVVNPEEVTKDNSFTYLVTPQFKVSPGLMVYARLASGYRVGGPNTTALLFHLPPHFDPDKTQNYELGAKGDFLNNKLSFDASVYYINWKDIQLQLLTPSLATYFGNASRAKSEGTEISVESRPLTGLKIGAWISLNDAVLTSGFPPASAAYGISGDRLPNAARFSGSLSLEQDFHLSSRVTGFVGGSIAYVSNREGVFTQTPERQNFPAYAKMDLRAGAKYELWSVNLYVNNVADRRGVLAGGVGGLVNPMAFILIQPRTTGLSISRTF